LVLSKFCSGVQKEQGWFVQGRLVSTVAIELADLKTQIRQGMESFGREVAMDRIQEQVCGFLGGFMGLAEA